MKIQLLVTFLFACPLSLSLFACPLSLLSAQNISILQNPCKYTQSVSKMITDSYSGTPEVKGDTIRNTELEKMPEAKLSTDVRPPMDIFLIDKITGEESEEMPIPTQLIIGIRTSTGSYYKLSHEPNNSSPNQNTITTGFLNPGKNTLFLPAGNFFEKTGYFKHNYLLDFRVNEKPFRERITIDIDIKTANESRTKSERLTDRKEPAKARLYELSLLAGNQHLYTFQKSVDFLKILLDRGKKSAIPGICEPTNRYSIANSPQTSSSVNLIAVASIIGKAINDKKEKTLLKNARAERELAKEKTWEIFGTFWKEDAMGKKVLLQIKIKISNRSVSF